jgi:hypothetical protein
MLATEQNASIIMRPNKNKNLTALKKNITKKEKFQETSNVMAVKTKLK